MERFSFNIEFQVVDYSLSQCFNYYRDFKIIMINILKYWGGDWAKFMNR